jgi:putative DNA primase/helicase
MNWRRVVCHLADAGLDIHNTFDLAVIVEHLRLARVTTRLRLVERGGWHGHHYLGSTGTIGLTSGDVPVRSGCFDMAPASDADDLALWQNHVAAPAMGNSRLVLALCAAFAGLAIGLLPSQGTFGLHLRGSSSTGKSTALAVAASIFGPAGRVIRNWRATDNGVEAMAEAHHHRLLILDEIAQIDPHSAAQVGYTLGNGIGKERASGAGRSRQPASWQLVFLSSGEISLEEKIAEWAGAPAMREGQRVMDLPADAGQGFGLFDTLHGFSDGAALSDHLKAITSRSTGDVAVAFVERLAHNIVAARLSLGDVQTRFLADHLARDGDSLTRRAFGNFALLAAAGEVAIGLGILPWPAGHAVEQIARCARDWVEARGNGQKPDTLT